MSGYQSEIDVRRTLHEKLGAQMEPYIILGACNPQLAHRALEQEPDIGLLLPGNIVVRAEGQGSRVDIADPQIMLGIVGNEQLSTVADEAKQRLQRVLAGQGSQHALQAFCSASIVAASFGGSISKVRVSVTTAVRLLVVDRPGRSLSSAWHYSVSFSRQISLVITQKYEL